jgi:hypothetical protein
MPPMTKTFAVADADAIMTDDMMFDMVLVLCGGCRRQISIEIGGGGHALFG